MSLTLRAANTVAGAGVTWLSNNTGTGTANTLTVNFLVTPLVGSLLTAGVGSDYVHTPPAGWSVAAFDVDNSGLFLFSKISDGTETGITVVPDGGLSVAYNVALAEYTGVAASPIDVTVTGHRSNSTSDPLVLAPSAGNTAQADELLIGLIGSTQAIGNTITWDTYVGGGTANSALTHTERLDIHTTKASGTNVGLSVCTATQLATGTIGFGATPNAATGASILMVSFKAAAAAGADDPTIHPSTPDIISNNGDLVTASFTAPANSLIVALIAGQTSTTEDLTYLVSDSGGLTWSKIVNDIFSTDGGVAKGCVEIWWAYQSSSASRSVTATGNFTRPGRMQVLVIQNADPIASSGAFSVTRGITGTPALNVVTTKDGSIVIGVVSDTNASITAPSYVSGTTEFSKAQGGSVSGYFFKTGVVTSAATSKATGMTAPAGMEFHFAAYEIRNDAAGGGGPSGNAILQGVPGRGFKLFSSTLSILTSEQVIDLPPTGLRVFSKSGILVAQDLSNPAITSAVLLGVPGRGLKLFSNPPGNLVATTAQQATVPPDPTGTWGQTFEFKEAWFESYQTDPPPQDPIANAVWLAKQSNLINFTPTPILQSSSEKAYMLLTGSVTSAAISNPEDGQTFQLYLQQVNGGRTWAWNQSTAVANWITPASGANQATMYEMQYWADDATWYVYNRYVVQL